MHPARIHNSPALHLIGPRASYSHATRAGIPDQWANWDYEAVSGVTSDLVYGVSIAKGPPDRFDYICALPVAASAQPPKGQEMLFIPPTRFAIFDHHGHVSGMAALFDAINCGKVDWPDGLTLADGPQLEVYGEGFDPVAASGHVEIWVPVARRQ